MVVGILALGLRYAASRATADARFHGDPDHRVFDSSRDALADLKTAKQQAAAEHKTLLMDVGGNWCPSCILLDQMLKSDADLRRQLARDYVLLHVNWSSDNRNQAVLSTYPEAHGYPALYVLAADGRLIKAEDTTELEAQPNQGRGYSHAAISAFLAKYAPRA